MKIYDQILLIVVLNICANDRNVLLENKNKK